MSDLVERLRNMGNVPQENCKVLEDAIATIEALRRERDDWRQLSKDNADLRQDAVAAMRDAMKDAMRYRWLRSWRPGGYKSPYIWTEPPWDESSTNWWEDGADKVIDAAIDAALATPLSVTDSIDSVQPPLE